MDFLSLTASLSLDSSQYEHALQRARSIGKVFTEQTNQNQDTMLGRAKQAFGAIGKLFPHLRKETDSLPPAIGRVTQGFTVLKGVTANLVSGGINLLASSITQNLGGAISRVDTLNNYGKVMVNLGKDADEAEEAINELAEGINGLPTTLDSIASTQQQFVALGSSLEDATDLTLALNNATLAGGQGQEKANSAMQQWYQMIANGKSDATALQIINEAMPAQLAAITEKVVGAGKSFDDLNEAWQKNPEITEKVKQAILDLNKEGLHGTKGFAEQAKDATKGIATSMQNMRTAISRGIAKVIDEIGATNITDKIGLITDGIDNAFEGISGFVANVKDVGLGEALSKVVDDAVNVLDKLPKVMEIVVGEAKKAFEKFASEVDYAGLVGKIIQGIATNLPKVVETIADFFSNTLAPWIAENGADIVISLGEGMIKALPTVVSAMGQIANGILKVVVGIPALLLAKGMSAIGSFVLGLLKKANSVATAGAKIVSAVVKGIKRLPSQLLSWAVKSISSFVSGLGRGASKVASSAKKLATGAVNALRNGLSKVGDIGLNIVKGIGNGITNGTGWIKSKIKSWVGNVKSFLKNLFGIESPSKWARDVIGLNIDKGLALGIEQNTDMVDDAMQDLIPDVSTTSFIGNPQLSSSSPSNRIISPTINTNVTVSGAEDPDEWGLRFADRIKMELRTV